jgi:hypothetical protein
MCGGSIKDVRLTIRKGLFSLGVRSTARYNSNRSFILKPDAETIIREASSSAIGRLDNIDAERDRPLSDFDRQP